MKTVAYIALLISVVQLILAIQDAQINKKIYNQTKK